MGASYDVGTIPRFFGTNMSKPERWYWMLVVPLLIGGLVLWAVLPRLLVNPASPQYQSPRQKAPSPSLASQPLTGSASCSARGCHGSIEPALDSERCQLNEYTSWTRDPHADAYRVLFNKRSTKIVKLLGGDKPAHDDPRCLACHTNPLLATGPDASAFEREERLFGVGCESCHGSANQWLVAHTRPDWRTNKTAFAIPDLTDPVVQVRTCMGCHVGAAPTANSPQRDVNHDLIAAGHPRLNFEFGSYQANMPAHWRPRKQNEADVWAVGQRLSAEAALALLAHRAKAGPWPEFAEYDCFACHHSLALSSWRQADDSGRQPGTMPWGSWYFAMIPSVTGELPKLDALRTVMQRRLPHRGEVSAKTEAALKELHGVKNDSAFDRRRLLAFVNDKRFNAPPSWDGIEQIYLALHAVNQANPDAKVAKLLADLTPLRAVAPGYSGPLAFPKNGYPAFDPKAILGRIKELQ
jgi:Cytochrome c554 and c-prime